MMRASLIPFFGALALLVSMPAASAATISAGYSATELMSPCQEADNDARWGEAAETECEQYILGFVHALEISGEIGKDAGICPPLQNTADEVRWAFMRWVHASFTERKAISAADALMATLKESFPCKP